MTTVTSVASRVVEEPGMGRVEIFTLPTDQDLLLALLKDAFEVWWRDIVFGSLVQGAVFEIRAPNAPRKVSLFDGYLTVDFGAWHFHVCIGPHRGTPRNPVDPELARIRRTARAEMYRVLGADGAPRSWGLRLFNGKGDQQMTLFFPNPFLGENDRILKEPDWSRLSMWDRFRERYLGLMPDPLDRSGRGFRCGG
ncbi:hypothetical protein A6A40_25285 (plasmid) [Azospirillum humicireducens]|uniref:Uncharacterized protein n=1 Tax=Azospirillum humicireducens TaxID=1226968 RepID=A0A2R4VVA0_9PROT|nr:hypothetical protein [Azospirillum humicireducens]AWB08353.1 hypothetical protein A6A40_25285 [Azospirillum humicireducens]